ncbi:hypothetical protein [Gemmatimonas sp.]|uniref:hypothetical protein n=2 Tax=Gemmatimonas sp. TaxID=1962908 RepID=UPI0025B9634E|nr:hypothetical protein [Gemmatimonas sp.]MCA2982900.1 hypothetical protein [Gemmatimonas sp.]
MDNVSVCERRNHGGRVLAQEVTHILDQVLGGAEPLSILDLQGLGKSAWAGTDAVAHVDAERFLSEIKTTAKLQHPHILPLLDSGAAAYGARHHSEACGAGAAGGACQAAGREQQRRRAGLRAPSLCAAGH